MNHIMIVVILGLASFSFTEAKPSWAGKPAHHVVCELNSTNLLSCPERSSCAGDTLTLTYDSVNYDVTVCKTDGKSKAKDISSALWGEACLVTNSTDYPVKNSTVCDDETDTCSSSEITFTRGGDTYAATLCEGSEAIDLETFLISLGDKLNRAGGSISEEIDEGSGSDEEI